MSRGIRRIQTAPHVEARAAGQGDARESDAMELDVPVNMLVSDEEFLYFGKDKKAAGAKVKKTGISGK